MKKKNGFLVATPFPALQLFYWPRITIQTKSPSDLTIWPIRHLLGTWHCMVSTQWVLSEYQFPFCNFNPGKQWIIQLMFDPMFSSRIVQYQYLALCSTLQITAKMIKSMIFGGKLRSNPRKSLTYFYLYCSELWNEVNVIVSQGVYWRIKCKCTIPYFYITDILINSSLLSLLANRVFG